MARAIGIATMRISPIVGMLAFTPAVILPCVMTGSSRIAIEPTTAIACVQP